VTLGGDSRGEGKEIEIGDRDSEGGQGGLCLYSLSFFRANLLPP
jgi:hypothetical protein